MLQADITRYAYTLAAVGAEVMRIARLMNLRRSRMLKLLGGEPAATPIMEVETEEFDFDGNLGSES